MELVFLIIIISVLGPLIGGVIGVLLNPSNKTVYNLLAFAAGTMLGISFLQLIPDSLNEESPVFTIIGVIIGFTLMHVVDKLIPHVDPEVGKMDANKELGRTAIFLVIGMFIHNFPEGMAIALGSSATTSFTIALAISLHHIAEGICTSSSYYLYSKNKIKSVINSAVTTIPTLVGFLFFYNIHLVLSPVLISIMMAGTAGFMIYLSIEELIPSSCCRITNYTTSFSFLFGIISLLILSLF